MPSGTVSAAPSRSMNSAAIIRSSTPADIRPTIPLDWFAAAAADDNLAGLEVIELDVVEIELRTGAMITWGPM